MQRFSRLFFGIFIVLIVILIRITGWQTTKQLRQLPALLSSEQRTALINTVHNNQETQLKVAVTSETAQKLQVLEEIFQSKNDNDPRLDHELSQWTPAEKRALERRYDELQREARNEKGTIVFLIGRKLETPEDIEFMKKVISEPPCLSLVDCSKASQGSDLGANSSIEISLEYPQFVALKSLEAYLEKVDGKTPSILQVKQILKQARHSKNLSLSQMAISLWNRYPQQH